MHVPCVSMSVCAIASKHQAGLAVDRTKDLGAGYLSGWDPGLDTEETGGSQSWLLEEPGGPSQLLGRPLVWGLATSETLGLGQLPERPACMSAHEATGRSVDPGVSYWVN